MNKDLDFIKQLADLMTEKSLSELSLEEGNEKIMLKKAGCQDVKLVENTMQTVTKQQTDEVQSVSSKAVAVTSPMVGTFYSSPTPDGEPYVKVGDQIHPGQIVCIIEAMKLMNEIESDISGRVVEICVKNGQTIEFGQPLMYIE